MTYKTHLTTSLCVAIPVLAVTHELSILALGGVAIGSLLPDIDTPNSYLGRRVKPISIAISAFTEHRGIIHSLVPFAILIIAAICFKSLFIGAIAFGFLLHLVGDTFSVSGIKWMQPVNKKSLIMPYKWMKYKTGTGKEYIILAIALLILGSEIYFGHLGGMVSHARDFYNIGSYHHYYRHYNSY